MYIVTIMTKEMVINMKGSWDIYLKWTLLKKYENSSKLYVNKLFLHIRSIE